MHFSEKNVGLLTDQHSAQVLCFGALLMPPNNNQITKQNFPMRRHKMSGKNFKNIASYSVQHFLVFDTKRKQASCFQERLICPDTKLQLKEPNPNGKNRVNCERKTAPVSELRIDSVSSLSQWSQKSGRSHHRCIVTEEHSFTLQT